MVSQLSLIVTCFNSENICNRFSTWLSSVHIYFSQIIIIDDFSSDSTYDLFLRRLSNLKSVELIRLPYNSGRPSIPRNTGLKLAKSKRVVFMDVDDCLPLEYIKFLKADNTDHCYSGTKLTVPYENFNLEYKCDFYKKIKISPKILQYKNLITFSGCSLLLEMAITASFKNQALEDWLYWKEISEKNTVTFIKFTDVPVYYDNSPSLSPAKTKQIKRIKSKIGFINMPLYFFYTIVLRFQELFTKLRYKLKNNYFMR